MVGMPQRGSTGEFPDFCFSLSSVLIFRTFKMILKVVLEPLLDVPEVLLEVLDLPWRPWRRFWASMYFKSHVIGDPMYEQPHCARS